jgi:quercetin dioxygenase-like cupin family protein
VSTQAAVQPRGEDPVRVDPKHYTVEMENQNVRILRLGYGPHEKSVMHGHPSMVGFMLTDGHIRFTYADGRTEDIIAKAGRILSLPATEHLPENLGDQAVEALIVELKT